ncbi:MAG: PqqD family protein [Chloroflexi bacterium]|nr:MAG: PqqD family protein [Chloroflexota bacterium]
MDTNTILQRDDHVTFEVVAGEAILIDMRTGTYFSLNESGTEFWQRLDGQHTIGEIATEVAKLYNDKAAAYVSAVQAAIRGNEIPEESAVSLAELYELDVEDVLAHAADLIRHGAEYAGELLAEFQVDEELVSSDLLELAEELYASGLVKLTD